MSLKLSVMKTLWTWSLALLVTWVDTGVQEGASAAGRGVRACFSTPGVSRMSAENLGTLGMPAMIGEGPEDAGDDTRGP